MAFCELHFWNRALGKQTCCNVILPEQGDGPFPVLYLLHGYSDDHTIWTRRTSIERYVENLPLIVVMPDGGKGFYCDAVVGTLGGGNEGDAYETAITRDLINFVDSRFRTRPEASGRAIAGLSMGGYGALKLALKFPHLFCAAVSHSGALHFAHANPQEPADSRRNTLVQRILGDDPANRAANDLYVLATNFTPETLPPLRIDCGTEDFLIEPNRAFHDYLQSLDLSHQYAEFPGAHDWSYWDTHIQDTIAFLRPYLNLASD